MNSNLQDVTNSKVSELRNSAFFADCHECGQATNRMWQTRHCQVRACSKNCADAFDNGAGADACACGWHGPSGKIGDVK